jgi:polysaccharide biosynthesis protein PslH
MLCGVGALNILLIATRIPYPLTDGGKVCLFNTVKYLALRGHKITLLAYENEQLGDLTPLHEICTLRTVHKSTRDSLFGGFFNLFSHRPYKVSKYISGKLKKAVERIVQAEQFDVVHVEQLHVGEYGVLCKQLRNLPIVLREQNVESVIVERFVERYTFPVLRMYLQNQLTRMQTYEAKLADSFDACCMITEEDRLKMLGLQSTVRTCVVTAGVDSAYFQNHRQ